jgi:hypothetical protein
MTPAMSCDALLHELGKETKRQRDKVYEPMLCLLDLCMLFCCVAALDRRRCSAAHGPASDRPQMGVVDREIEL